MARYVEVHCHSEFSLPDGASTPEELLEVAASLGYDRLGLADVGTVAGWPRFAARAQELGLETLLGMEVLGLVLLARDERGVRSLLRLASRGGLRGEKDRPEFAPADLEGLEGLVCLVGPRSRAARLLLEGDRAGALREVEHLRRTCGELWVELVDGWLPHSLPLMREMADLADRLGVGVVAGGDVWHARRQDHAVSVALGRVRDPSYRPFPHSRRHLRPPGEVARAFAHLPEAVANTRLLPTCELPRPRRLWHLPAPPGELRRLALEGARRAYGRPLPAEVEARLERELGEVEARGLEGYFLAVWDLVREARGRGIAVSGRGAGVGSLLLYCLGATRVDPLAHGLLFERFLGEGTPDVDLDVDSDRRQELLAYLAERYPSAMLCTRITLQGRLAARDLERCLPQLPPERRAELAERLRGRFRHTGLHVGGVVAGQGLEEALPLCRGRDGRAVVAWDKDDLEELGVPKIDVLGLRGVAVVEAAKGLLAARGLRVEPMRRLADREVWERLWLPDAVGVFGLESRAQGALLPRVRPMSFEDLTVLLALVRPGPIEGGALAAYVRRREGAEPATVPHPLAEGILSETLGVCVFQEQVLRLLSEGGGMSLSEAERARRRLRRSLGEVRARFLLGARERGVGEEAAGELWAMIEGFASYGFCKGHAAAMAAIAWESAWLRHRHPPEYYCARIDHFPLGFYPAEVLLRDAERHGVRVLPPDVHRSGVGCTLEGRAVRLGLSWIKGVGKGDAERVVRARAGGRFRSLGDLRRRAGLSRDVLAALVLAGACGDLGERRALAWEAAWDGGALALPAPAWEVGAMGEDEAHLWEDTLLGWMVGAHPLDAVGELEGVTGSSRLGRLRAGAPVSVAGVVASRQSPPRARGLVFLSLEDREGLVDVVVPRELAQRPEVRRALGARLLLVEGTWRGRAVLARRLSPLTPHGWT